MGPISAQSNFLANGLVFGGKVTVEKIKEATNLAANYLVSCHTLLLETYLKNHDIQKSFACWYVEDYREVFMWAVSPGPLFSEPTPIGE